MAKITRTNHLKMGTRRQTELDIVSGKIGFVISYEGNKFRKSSSKLSGLYRGNISNN